MPEVPGPQHMPAFQQKRPARDSKKTEGGTSEETHEGKRDWRRNGETTLAVRWFLGYSLAYKYYVCRSVLLPEEFDDDLLVLPLRRGIVEDCAQCPIPI